MTPVCSQSWEEGKEMEIKSFATTLGVGMVAGAATMLLIPRHSQAYRTADEAAHAIKKSVKHKIDDLMD